MLLYIIFFGLMCLLQYWLSGRKSRIPGLILPALQVILSIIIILSFAAYSYDGASYSITTVAYETVEDESGNVLSITEAEDASVGIIGGADGPTSIFVPGPDTLLMLVMAFAVANIPTAIYLAIYSIVRHNKKHNTVNKTLIQDL